MKSLDSVQKTWLASISIGAILISAVVAMNVYGPPSPPPCETKGQGADAVIVCSGIMIKGEEAVRFAIAYNASRAASGYQPMTLNYAITGR